MKFVVDRIENEIVILENMKTKEIIEIESSIIPFKVKDGNILNYQDGTYSMGSDYEKKRRDNLRRRLEKLKNKR